MLEKIGAVFLLGSLLTLCAAYWFNKFDDGISEEKFWLSIAAQASLLLFIVCAAGDLLVLIIFLCRR